MGKTVTGKTKREKRRAKQMRQKRGTGREIRATPAGARPGVGTPLASPHSPSQLSPSSPGSHRVWVGASAGDSSHHTKKGRPAPASVPLAPQTS